MNSREKAQKGRDMIEEAVMELVSSSERAMSHAAIVKFLDIPSDFEGVGQNYLSWSILGLLVNSGSLRYRGDRQNRVYYVRDEQLV